MPPGSYYRRWEKPDTPTGRVSSRSEGSPLDTKTKEFDLNLKLDRWEGGRQGAEGWLSKAREYNIQRHGVDSVSSLFLEVNVNCPLNSSLSLN